MVKSVTALFITLCLFGTPEICMGDYQDQFPEMQNEEQLEVQMREAENEKCHCSPNCPNCTKKKHRKKDRFFENQRKDTGWPGRRDELSDQLSR